MPSPSANGAVVGGGKVVANCGYNGGTATCSDRSMKSRKRSCNSQNDFMEFDDMNDLDENKRYNLL